MYAMQSSKWDFDTSRGQNHGTISRDGDQDCVGGDEILSSDLRRFLWGYVTNTTLDTALEAAESYFHVQPVCISTPMLRDMQSGKAENNARSRRQPIRRKLPRIHIADRAFDLSVVTRRGPCQSTRSRSSRYYRLSSVKRALAGETN